MNGRQLTNIQLIYIDKTFHVFISLRILLSAFNQQFAYVQVGKACLERAKACPDAQQPAKGHNGDRTLNQCQELPIHRAPGNRGRVQSVNPVEPGRQQGVTVIELMIIPLMSIIIAATNYWHVFMWYLPIANAAGEFLTRPVAWGPWFQFVHLPYGYAVIGTSIFTLVMHSSAVAPAQRRGLFLLAGSAMVPIIGVVAYDMGLGPNTMSTLPPIFAMMLPVYAWLIIGERIIEFTPLAYETVFQNMQDPVIVIDDEERNGVRSSHAPILSNFGDGLVTQKGI